MNDPEFKLLVASCRSTYVSSVDRDVQRSSEHVNWPRFLQLARRHRVQGLVAQAFFKAAVAPPPDVSDALSADAAAIAERNLRCATEGAELSDALTAAKIAHLFVKGISLSALAYGDPFVKMSSDIDLLVGLDDVDKAAVILEQLGYGLTGPRGRDIDDLPGWHRRHKDSVWRSKTDGALIELHTRLAGHPALIPQIGLSSPRQDVAIGQGRYFSTLNTDDLIIYLCVHGSSSAWFRLKWIVDLTALIHRSKVDLGAVYARADRNGAGRPAAQALLLGDGLGLFQLPSDLSAELHKERANRLLLRLAYAQLMDAREPTQHLFGTATIHLTQPLLFRSWQLKLSEIARQAREVVDTYRQA